MAQESMEMREGFSAQVQRAPQHDDQQTGAAVEVKPRHRVIGWTILFLIMAVLVFAGSKVFAAQEGVRLGETFKATIIHKASPQQHKTKPQKKPKPIQRGVDIVITHPDSNKGDK